MTGTILIVDDNRNNLAFLEQMLMSEGFLVRVATSGEIALKAVRTHPPELILLDVMMPGLSGFEVCRQLKADPRTAAIPILFISALHETQEKLEAFQMGGQDYITKPFSAEEVLARVHTHLRLYRMECDLQAAVRDAIAAKELAFEEVRRSEERYRRITEALTDYTYTVSVGPGGVTRARHGEGAWQVTGFAAEELNAAPSFASQMGYPLERAQVAAQDADLLAGGRPAAVEHRLTRRDGEERWVRRTVLGRPDEDGALRSYDVLIQDITDGKRAEAQRDRLEQQLRVAQKMEAIGSLAGGVAHDFNNLITVILSYAGFAMQAVAPNDPLREDLQEVEKAGERAAALTRQLLAFSRKQVLQPARLDLNKTVTEIEKMLHRILGEDIDLRHALAPDLGAVRADPGQIEQVLMNLLVNARDAMPEGGKLTVETANVEIDLAYSDQHVEMQPGSYVMLAVTDTGCGMDRATQARIFEPFFTTKTHGKGTGLGLATVYGIVKQSDGYIWVYSEPGRGTTFKIYLPLDCDVVEPVTRRSAALVRSGGGETVLVVEDELAVRKMVRRVLELSGYTVLTAANGIEALQLSERHPDPLHLLLTDVVMPQIGGRVLAERLTAMRPTLKVLYMSGYTDNAIVHHGTLDPGTNFISKPFDPAGLAKKVREVLDLGDAAPGVA